MNILPLEDTPEDIVKKACLAHGVSAYALPGTGDRRNNFLREKLDLDPDALASLPEYHPHAILPEGLTQHSFPFYESEVNIWSLRTTSGIILIDTGCSPEQLRSVLKEEQMPQIEAVLLTHDHHDHSGGMSMLKSIPVYHANNQHSRSKVKSFTIDGLLWEMHLLPGHTADSAGFITHYKGDSLFFTGDALFAGSMGRLGTGTPAAAISRIVTALANLPVEALILPGHGPATTLAQEKLHNPFLKGKI